MSYEPKLIVFCCNWCSYPAADLAGVNRMQYPAGVRVIRLMCSGMLHPDMVLKAMQKGADGVLVLGCHPGECHYLDGNQKARDRAEAISELLEDMGFEADRFKISWCSSAEPDRFVATITEMVDTLKKLGPP